MPTAHVVETLRSPTYATGQLPRISVVVSTFGRSEFLRELIAALEAQSVTTSEFEVVLVDNGSKDDTWERIADEVLRSGLRMLALRVDVNYGAGAGRNAGVKQARAAVLAFTDDDCIPAPGWLKALTSQLTDHGGPEPPPLVIQGQTVPWSADRNTAGPWDRTVWVLRPTWLFETCNLAYRRSDLDAVGGFPEGDDAPRAASNRAFGEDAVLGWKVVSSGAQLCFERDAVVEHRHIPATYLDWLLEQRRRGDFPGLVVHSPLGRRALWARWFLAPRSAAFDLALAGILPALLTRRSRWLGFAVPWLWLALPEAGQRGGRHPTIRLCQIALGDLVGCIYLTAGSARSRSIVL